MSRIDQRSREDILEPIPFELSAIELLSLHGYAWLGCKHPDTKGPSKEFALNCIVKIAALLKEHDFLDEEDVTRIYEQFAEDFPDY